MVIVWRGLGIAVPILAGIAAVIMSYFFDDTRLGNAPYIGWSLISASVPVLLVGLASLSSGEEGEQGTGGWLQHTLFLIPVIAWFPIMLGGGIYLLMGEDDSDEGKTVAASRPAATTPEADAPAPLGETPLVKVAPTFEPFVVSDTPRTTRQWMSEIKRGAVCPSEAFAAWCEAAGAWADGDKGQLDDGDSVFVGLTIDLHGGKDLAAALRKPAISILVVRKEGDAVLGDLSTVETNPTVAATVDGLVGFFSAGGPKVEFDAGLAEFLRTLPKGASEVMSHGESGWSLAASVPTEIRRVGAHWVVFETHGDRAARVGMYTALPPA